jgi:hypothetical protein
VGKIILSKERRYTTMSTERKPIITETVNLEYTKGIYTWFTNSVAKLFIIVMSILNAVTKIDMIDYFRLVSCLWIVNHNANKLQGISSISSSVHDNCFCKARQAIADCICKFCYAYNQQSYQTGLKEHNILNGIILRNVLIPVKAFKSLPILFPYLRIESFGDVANVIQARNYIRIIKAFPGKRCAIWSKNKEIWKQAFSIEGKPKNTTYVHSSSKLNTPDNIDRERYNFIDHVFTVYTKAYIKKHNIIINCGGKKCIKCIMEKKNCYFRNTEFYINEQKK